MRRRELLAQHASACDFRLPIPDRLDLLQPLANFRDHRILVGKPAALQLAVDQLLADRQLEAAAGRWLERQSADAALELIEELVRQTDGLRLIVSHRAVAKMNLHD